MYDCQTLWHFITSKQDESEILKCKFDNSLKITTTALIFQSMFLVTTEIQKNKKKKQQQQLFVYVI